MKTLCAWKVARRLLLFLVLAGAWLLADFSFAASLGQLSFRQEQLLSETLPASSARVFQVLSVEVSNLNRPTRLDPLDTSLKGQISGQVVPGVPVLNSLSIQQLYVDVAKLSVGRRVWDWSQVDQNFQLGLFQPLNNSVPLRPQIQGQTGVFLQIETRPEEGTPRGLILMGSSLFIPDQQPGYEFRDGQFSSNNPWFPALPRKLQFDARGALVDRIRYDLQIPETQSILFQPVYMGQAYWGDRRLGPRITLSWAQKPSHQLSLAVAGYSTTTAGEGVTVIPVRPQSYLHQLASADFTQRWSSGDLRWAAGLSVVRERPQAPSYSSGWNYNEYAESLLWSPFVEAAFQEWRLSFASLEIQGGESLPRGPSVRSFSNFLPDRYPFQRAVRTTLQWERVWNRREALALQSRWLTHPSGGFNLWDQTLHYQFQSRWTATLSVLLVEANESQSKTLLGRLQNLDLMSLGISYAF